MSRPSPLLPPVVRTLELPGSGADAFAAFTADLGRWWPLGFTGSGETLADVVMDGRAGGRIYEVDRKGRETDWGTVRVFEAPTRLVLAWGLGLDGDPRTEVELRFADQRPGSRLAFEHRGFLAGEEAVRGKFDSPGGWDVILEAFRQHLAESG